MKRAAARAALGYLETDAVIGVGTGSTVRSFIAALAEHEPRPRAAVPTSRATTEQLTAAGIPLTSLEEVRHIGVYVDGADEVDPLGRLIKGAGGASTQEKIVASASDLFVCIVDESKLVDQLGERAPVPLEVVREAVESVSEIVTALGGRLRERARILTDSGNALVDIRGLDLGDPEAAELALDAIPGVVECGIFARRRADVVVVGTAAGSVRTIDFRAGRH